MIKKQTKGYNSYLILLIYKFCSFNLFLYRIVTSSTPKPKTFAAKTSGTTISINRAQSAFANKPKSVATVRPTVQNQLYQTKQKKTNTIQRSTTTSFIQQQHQLHRQQQQRPTTSTASTSRSHQLPILARKPLSTATASSSTLVGKKITLPSPSLKTNTLVKKVAKRPATIVKPEKIITKDPVDDPLSKYKNDVCEEFLKF